MSHDLTAIPFGDLPLALARLHRASPAGAVMSLVVPVPTPEEHAVPATEELLHGAAFTPVTIERTFGAVGDGSRSGRAPAQIEARRERSLPDWVGPDLRLLVCGLNPSLHAADAGVGYAGPGNRFWPAALASGLVSRDRDPEHALIANRVGMTDLVKRATVKAAEVSGPEYRAGIDRLERLVTWLRPTVLCVVGLSGWRAGRDRQAAPGLQPERLGPTPVYLMPSTSGLNAAISLADLTDHLRQAAALAP